MLIHTEPTRVQTTLRGQRIRLIDGVHPMLT
jgi:hypothetical protein